MKTVLILVLFSTGIHCQNSSINCDSLFSIYSGQFAVSKMPELVGGMDSLQLRLIYPDQARENKIEGKVYFLAIIDSNGKPICVKVIKGLGYGCDEEVLRLINTSSFYPGLLRDKPITTIITLPIVFSLEDDK